MRISRATMVATGLLTALLLGAMGGAVLAQAVRSPDVMYRDEVVYSINDYPRFYEEGITVAEWSGQHLGGRCRSDTGAGAAGVLTTTRFGDRVVQEVVTDEGVDCTRAGLVSTDRWISDWIDDSSQAPS